VLLTVIISPALAFVAGVFTRHVEVLMMASNDGVAFTPGQARAVSVALIAGLTLLNVRGTRLGALVQNVSMLGKAGGIVALVLLGAGVALGWLDAPPHAVVPDAGATGERAVSALTFGGLATALISVVFSYGGWQNVTAVSSEVVRPERTLPLGILLGTALVVLLYMALNASLVAILGVDALAASPTPVASAAQAVTPVGGLVVAGLIALSTFAIVQALLMVAPRIFYAMAADGIFFGAAARVHPRWHTPWVAVCLLGGAGVVHVFLIGELGDLLEITTQGDAVFFALSALALFRLRRTQPELPRPYRAQGYPVIPAIFLTFSAGMVLSVAVNASAQVVAVVAGLFAVGGVLYACWRR
jgi:amino acid transporter